MKSEPTLRREQLLLIAPEDVVIDEQPRDSRCTPPEIVALAVAALGGTIDLDPCSNGRSTVPALLRWTRHHSPDGAPIRNWPARARTFVNPPWSDPSPWVELIDHHARRRSRAERCHVVAVLPCDPSVGWWRHVWGADAILWPSRRINFVAAEGVTASSNRWPIVIAAWGKSTASRLRRHGGSLGPVSTGPVRTPRRC